MLQRSISIKSDLKIRCNLSEVIPPARELVDECAALLAPLLLRHQELALQALNLLAEPRQNTTTFKM